MPPSSPRRFGTSAPTNSCTHRSWGSPGGSERRGTDSRGIRGCLPTLHTFIPPPFEDGTGRVVPILVQAVDTVLYSPPRGTTHRTERTTKGSQGATPKCGRLPPSAHADLNEETQPQPTPRAPPTRRPARRALRSARRNAAAFHTGRAPEVLRPRRAVGLQGFRLIPSKGEKGPTRALLRSP